jgi:hypothetical protein
MKRVSVLIIFVLFAACSAPELTNEEGNAVTACKKLCNDFTGDRDGSPCIGNPMYSGWVCDLAHSPRVSVDNAPENQCSAFREGRAQRFVELDKKCALLRVS